MALTDDRFVVFRLGGNGFVLSLGDVVEVVDRIADTLDSLRRDAAAGIVAALDFRGTWLPVIDPGLRLNLGPRSVSESSRAIVLQGSEGRWALLVDSVVELSSTQNLQSCEMTLLLQQAVDGLYSELKLLNAEPLIVFDPELYYGLQVQPL